jgi:K+-transporting ATPase KdpF subunit
VRPRRADRKAGYAVNSVMTVVAAAVSIVLLGYLVVALIRPEKF